MQRGGSGDSCHAPVPSSPDSGNPVTVLTGAGVDGGNVGGEQGDLPHQSPVPVKSAPSDPQFCGPWRTLAGVEVLSFGFLFPRVNSSFLSPPPPPPELLIETCDYDFISDFFFSF